MIPASQSAYNIYLGGSAATVFDFEFDIQNADDLLVFVYDVSSDTKTTLVLDIDYTISGSSITLTSPLEENKKIILLSAKKVQQQYDFFSSDKFDPQKYEDALDYVVTLIKQNERDARFAFKLPLGVSDVDVTMPKPVASKLLKWNTQGNKIENSSADADELESMSARLHDSIGNIDAVADNLDNINSVNSNKDNIDIVANLIDYVNVVGTNISNVSAVADNLDTINSVNSNKDNIDTCVANIDSINSVAEGVQVCADNINNITAVNENITNINSTASNLTNINTVAVSINDVSSCANGIESINTVSENISNILDNASNVSDCSLNMESIKVCASYKEAIQGVYDGIENVDVIVKYLNMLNELWHNLSKLSLIHAYMGDVLTVSTYIEEINMLLVMQSEIDAVVENKKNIETCSENIDAIKKASLGASQINDSVQAIKDSVDLISQNSVNIATNSSAISSLETELQTTNSNISSLETELQITNSNIATNSSAISSLETELQTTNSNISSLETELQITNSNIATNEENILKLKKQGSAAYTRFAINQANTDDYGSDIQLLDYTMEQTDEFEWAAQQISFKIGGDYPTLKVTNAQGETIEITETPDSLIPSDYYHDRNDNEWANDLLYVDKTGFHVIQSCGFYTSESSKFVVDQLNDGDKAGIVLCTNSEPIKAYLVTKGQNGNEDIITEFDGVPICSFVVERQGEEGDYHYGFVAIEDSILHKIGYNGYNYNTNVVPYGFVSNVQKVVLNLDNKNLQYDEITIDLINALWLYEYNGLFNIEVKTSMTEDLSVYVNTRAYQEEFDENAEPMKQCIGRTTDGILKTSFSSDVLGSEITLYFETDSGQKVYIDKVKLTLLTARQQKYKGYGFVFNPDAEIVYEDGSLSYTIELKDNDTLTHYACLKPLDDSVEDDILEDAGICVIDWGDGTTSEFSGSEWKTQKTHTYSAAGSYKIRITNTGDSLYLKGVFACMSPDDEIQTDKEKSTQKVISVDSVPPVLDFSDRCFSGGFTYCSGLKSVPKMVLKNLILSSNTSLYDLYRGTAFTRASAELFEGLENPEQIISVYHCFDSSSIEKIDSNLFDLFTGLVDASGVFALTNISVIPSNLFAKHKSMYKVGSAFFGNYNLTDIPDGLFEKNFIFDNIPYIKTNVGSVKKVELQYCFLGCVNMVLHPNIFGTDKTRFKDFSDVNLCRCFAINHTGSYNVLPARTNAKKGTAPDLWNWELPANTNHEGCFAGHSADTLTNYDDIPDDWK